jgi:exodeoxyribonuclease V beta subunit
MEISPASLDAMPGGVETGHLLHRLFETIDFRCSPEALSAYVAQEMRDTPLEAFVDQISSLVQEVSSFPLLGPAGQFSLGDVDPQQMIREMEFLYPSTTPSGYIKGFIDLFFSHQGSCYLIDWKSNMLSSYTPDRLHQVMQEEGYMLQGKIYVEAIHRYLRLFQTGERLAGMFFFFLRGVDSGHERGVYAYPP